MGALVGSVRSNLFRGLVALVSAVVGAGLVGAISFVAMDPRSPGWGGAMTQVWSALLGAAIGAVGGGLLGFRASRVRPP